MCAGICFVRAFIYFVHMNINYIYMILMQANAKISLYVAQIMHMFLVHMNPSLWLHLHMNIHLCIDKYVNELVYVSFINMSVFCTPTQIHMSLLVTLTYQSH